MANRKAPYQLPSTPKVFTPVRVAATSEENEQAKLTGLLGTVSHGANWEDMTDDDFVALALEPELLADCTPLERELIVRLSARLELEKELEAERV